MYKKTLEQQFWSKVDKKTKKECWLWTGAKNNAGYGNMRVSGKYVNSHRVSYTIHYGPIEKGFVICHKCDNPTCVNPNHLFSGLPIDNDADKVRKNRHIYGVKSPMSKLNNEQVRKIIAQDGTQQKIADEYNVSRRLIGMIKNRKIWKHIK